jgi:hypothetical protein
MLGKQSFFLPGIHTASKAHQTSYSVCTLYFPRCVAGHDASHSPPSSAKVKNECSYMSTPIYGFIVCKATTCLLSFFLSYLLSLPTEASDHSRYPSHSSPSPYRIRSAMQRSILCLTVPWLYALNQTRSKRSTC